MKIKDLLASEDINLVKLGIELYRKENPSLNLVKIRLLLNKSITNFDLVVSNNTIVLIAKVDYGNQLFVKDQTRLLKINPLTPKECFQK